MGAIKKKLGLRGPQKPGAMIARMNEIKHKTSSFQKALNVTGKVAAQAVGVNQDWSGKNDTFGATARRQSVDKGIKKFEGNWNKTMQPARTTLKRTGEAIGNAIGSNLIKGAGAVSKGVKLAGDVGKAFVRNTTGGDVRAILKKKTSKGLKTSKSRI